MGWMEEPEKYQEPKCEHCKQRRSFVHFMAMPGVDLPDYEWYLCDQTPECRATIEELKQQGFMCVAPCVGEPIEEGNDR